MLCIEVNPRAVHSRRDLPSWSESALRGLVRVERADDRPDAWTPRRRMDVTAQRDAEAVDPLTERGHPKVAPRSEKSGPAHEQDGMYPRSLRRIAFLEEREVMPFQ